MKSGFHGDNVTIVGWMLPLLMGKKTPGLQECDRITAHLVGIYCLVAGLFHVFARSRNLRWLFQSPEASEANDVRTRPDSGCTISRNRTHQHPICFEHSSWKPCFYCFQQFQFCVIGIWWGRVGLPRVETLMLEIRRGHRLLTEGPGSGADSSTMTGYLWTSDWWFILWIELPGCQSPPGFRTKTFISDWNPGWGIDQIQTYEPYNYHFRAFSGPLEATCFSAGIFQEGFFATKLVVFLDAWEKGEIRAGVHANHKQLVENETSRSAPWHTSCFSGRSGSIWRTVLFCLVLWLIR